ncbi:MAG: hypothetical protein R2714_07225 [Microthrixaceae bacterium]
MGAIAVAHHGVGGSPLGLVLAVVFAALVGIVVALPVMRLSGIYLALATAALAVALDRWLFNLPDFDIGPVHISIFEVGSVSVDPIRLFGRDFNTPGSLMMPRRSPSHWWHSWSRRCDGVDSVDSSWPCATARQPARHSD